MVVKCDTEIIGVINVRNKSGVVKGSSSKGIKYVYRV